MDEILDKLNDEQRKPVQDTEGAVLVLAGAGSGKTRVLTSRIAYILREGLADSNGILAITFTNKAAAEMKERVLKVCENASDMWICTIHSMCVRILRKFSSEAGVKYDFSIYSETERRNVIKKALKELCYDEDKALKDAGFHIANAKMLGLDPDQYFKMHKYEPHMNYYMKVFETYERHLNRNNALDFDDLLIYTRRLLRKDKDVRMYLSDMFKYVLVDEFQDTNAVQYDIIKLLTSVHGNLFVVGDDDQSIYGWRGAKIENILKFDVDFPDAKVYKLERNYRSTESIIRLANSSIKYNTGRRGKTLWTNEDRGEKPLYFAAESELHEALFVTKTIVELMSSGDYKYSDFAVLMRINALTRSFEQEFNKYSIPYKVFGGLKFFERKVIKDVLAYLRLIVNPYDDEALTRIINVPRRGIGDRTLEEMDRYATLNGCSLYDAVLACDELPINSGMKSRLKEFCDLIKELIISAQQTPVFSLVREVINLSGLKNALEDENDIANIDEYVASVDDFSRLNPSATLSDYLCQITLYSDTDEMDNGDYLTLATIHAVKGLEFRVVFIVGLEDGIMPSSRAASEDYRLEEERRLMYVAITRAKERLYLTRAKERNLYGHRDRTAISRFVKELLPQLKVKKEEHDRASDYMRESRSGRTDMPKHENPFSGAVKFFASMPQNSEGDKKAIGGYRAGMKVFHPKFGKGTVIAIRNDGAVINVAFEGQGIKELSAMIAPLTIIQ